jgi:hypothetical protein
MSTGTPIRPGSSHSAGSLPGRTDPRAGVVATGRAVGGAQPAPRRTCRRGSYRSALLATAARRAPHRGAGPAAGRHQDRVVVGGEPVGLLPRPSVCAASDSDGGSGTRPRRRAADAQGRHRGGGRPGRASAGRGVRHTFRVTCPHEAAALEEERGSKGRAAARSLLVHADPGLRNDDAGSGATPDSAPETAVITGHPARRHPADQDRAIPNGWSYPGRDRPYRRSVRFGR